MDTAAGGAVAAEQAGGGDATTTSIAPAAFLQDPVAFLSVIAAKPASPQSMEQLGGPVSNWFANQFPDDSSSVTPVAAAYLQAAAVQLQETSFPAGGNAQLEAIAIKAQYEVVTTVGMCATLCKNRRGAITGSGILPSLANLWLNSPTQQQNVNQLSLLGVEFLQCALLAEQYRYAARLVAGTWPRPDMTVNVKLVLRYYYLRGMIHLGCNDFVMAHRCFWTCLSVPADVCCKIAIEAWKKLVLVQCIMNDGSHPDANKTTLPKSLPTCMGRLLASSRESTKDASSSNSAASPSEAPPRRSAGASRTTRRGQPQLGDLPAGKKTQNVDSESTAFYMDITTAFFERDRSKLEALLVEHKTTLESDGNFGLVQQCLTQLMNNQVRHISKMYSVISVAKAASLLGIADSSSPVSNGVGDVISQQVALRLCQSGVACEIQDDGMIVFGNTIDQPDDSITPPTTSLVDLSEWMTLFEKVQRLDVNILTSARYQSLARKELAVGGSGSDEAKAAAAAGPRGVEDI